MREPVSLGDGLEVIVTDVVIPPNAEIPAHFHPSEEIVYVIEGSAVHRENGKPQRKLVAGDSIVIAPGAHHAPRGGPNGARAIVFRLHKSGSVEAIPVDEPAAAE